MPSSLKKKNKDQQNNLSKIFIFAGLFLVFIGIVIFSLTFYQIIFLEIKYSANSISPRKKNLKPIDKNFSIVIPKIEANAKVIANVNPYNEREYQWQLTKGVAHAKGTALPGQYGNIFLFSHSSNNWYEANRYNSIFYLLHKMEKGDKIEIYYKKKKFSYKVKEKKLVDANAVNYLVGNSNQKTLTLMTCWPPGTSFKRLLIIADQLK